MANSGEYIPAAEKKERIFFKIIMIFVMYSPFKDIPPFKQACELLLDVMNIVTLFCITEEAATPWCQW